MSAAPSLTSYLLHESFVRWRSRVSVPLARLVVALSLSTAALLVLASFALGAASLQSRIAEFGLDSLVVRAPMRRTADPAPKFPALRELGRVLTLKLPYASVRLDAGRTVPLAIAESDTLIELAALGVKLDRVPLLLSAAQPSGAPVRATLGPWNVNVQASAIPTALRPLAFEEILVARAEDFPLQANLPGNTLILFVRSSDSPPLENIAAALQAVIAANPTGREATPTVQSAVPLLRELRTLQTAWLGYATLLAAVLAATIAVVFGSGALLELEATAYATALLRSFGVSRVTLWFQRYAEAALLANFGGLLAVAISFMAARAAVPQVAPHLLAFPVIFPVFLALNAGALVAALPVAAALRRPVGLILQ